MPEADIIDRVLAGDRERYGDLVVKYTPLVRGIATSHVFEPGAHDDIVQETFVEGFVHLRTLQKPERFGPWLAAIARNKCRMWYRGRKRFGDTVDRLDAQLITPETSLPRELVNRELCEIVRSEISRLPARSREAMVLVYVEGFAPKDAAAVLGIRPNALKQRLHSGRRAVSESLLERLPGFMRADSEDRAKVRDRALSALPAGPAQGLRVSLRRNRPRILATILVLLLGIVGALLLNGGAGEQYGDRYPERRYDEPAQPSAQPDFDPFEMDNN